MECNARVIVGLEVQHEDFWTEKVHKDDFISCPNGHEGQTGKFCSECGAALGYQEHTKLVANPNFAALVGDADPKGRAGEAWNPERDFCSEDRANPNAFGIHELQLLCVDGELGVDDAPQVLALGFVIHDVGSIGEGYGSSKPLGISESSLEHYFGLCRDLGTKLGIDREPQLYLHTSCG